MLPVVLPGRERRLGEPPVRTWGRLLDGLSDRLADLVSTSDYVIYGHSMGAWIGYELVRRFVAMDVPPPAHLVVAARHAPQLPQSLSPIAHLDDDAFMDAVHERYGAIPDAVRHDKELRALFLPALRADFALLEVYEHEPGPPIDVAITALHGTRDHLVDLERVEPWGALTSRTFQIRHVVGGHFFLRDGAAEVTDFIAQLFRQSL